MLVDEAANTGRVLLIGHRGAMSLAPENTMVSFARAYELGCDLIETDIHLSRDGVLVLMHDADVARTTGGAGCIEEMSLQEIRRLDAGGWYGEAFRGERVPLLSELLDWARTRIPLIIEIKGNSLPAVGIEAALLAQLREKRLVGDVMVTSFDHHCLRRLKDLEPSVLTGMNYNGRLFDTAGAARATGAGCVSPNWRFWDRGLVDAVHAAGLAAATFVPDDDKCVAAVVDMGMDALGVDCPDRVRPYLDGIGKSYRRS